MRKEVKGSVAGIILSFIVTALFIEIYLTREPSFKGRSFSSWLDQYYGNFPADRDAVRSQKLDEARAAILEIGTNAIPCLLAKVRKQDSSFEQRLLTVARKQSLGVVPFDRIDRRYSADHYHAMAGWGFSVLGSTGKPAIPSLIQLLKDDNPDVRSCAAHCLGDIGPDSRAAIPALLPLLWERNNGKVIRESMQALGSIHEQPEIVVPALLEFLNGRREKWGCELPAMRALEFYGEQAKVAVPAIEAYLKNPDPFNLPNFAQKQDEALNALDRIDPQAGKRAADQLRASRALR